MATQITFFGLSICYLQIEILRFTQTLLMNNCLFQIVHRYVQPIEADGVEIECTFEFVVHRHIELCESFTQIYDFLLRLTESTFECDAIASA